MKIYTQTQNIHYTSSALVKSKKMPLIFTKADNDLSSQTYINPISFKALYFKDKLTIAEKNEIKTLIDNYKENNEKIELLGKGTFGTVYKIKLKNKGEIAVKILSPENKEKLYGGGNLDKEAEILKNIPASCKRTQQLIEYFESNKKGYLASSIVKGKPLGYQNNISQKLMDNIVDELYKYDSNNLMFYDLNINNIIIDKDKDEAGFIDFEFMEFKNQKQINTNAFNDIHNIGRNFFHPQKSNINSFENRSLGKFIIDIEKRDGAKEAEKFVEKYLKSLSKYHRKNAILYKKLHNTPQSNISDSAVKYETILSRIYEKPTTKIKQIEKELITLRYTTLNYHLYCHRKNEGKLIEGDIETYGNFDNYIKDMNKSANNILKELNEISSQNINNQDIQLYARVNKFYIENFLRKNANKNYYELRGNSKINKHLEKVAKSIIANYNNMKKDSTLDSVINDFNKEYNSIKRMHKDDINVQNFCNDIKFVLDNTLDFIKKEQI